MPDGQPEGTQEPQAPQTSAQREMDFRERAIASVETTLGREVDEEPQGDGAATGDAPAATSASTDGAGDPKPQAGDGTGDGAGDSDDEPPTDPALFKAWWSEREQKLKADADERLANQRRSLTGDMNAERERLGRIALLDELDALTPEELTDRLNRDPKAASAIAQRTAETGNGGIAAAREYALNEQAPLVFKAFESLSALGGQKFETVFNDPAELEALQKHEGGVFGYLVDKTASVVGPAAVEKFKGSAEYRNAIEEARVQGARDALPGARMPAGAPTGTRAPATKTPTPEPTDPRELAMWRAAQRLGENQGVDTEELFGAGASRAGRRRAQVAG